MSPLGISEGQGWAGHNAAGDVDMRDTFNPSTKAKEGWHKLGRFLVQCKYAIS
jgi:hypothetical protein